MANIYGVDHATAIIKTPNYSGFGKTKGNNA
jgi:hypothetical protein